MLVGIHQSHYLPWLRYFEKIARSDVFILLDDVQYQKNGFQNRNKIKTAQGWTYLTVPVKKPLFRPICETEIDNGNGWRQKHRRALEMNYQKAPYFQLYWPELAELYEQEWKILGDLNQAMLQVFLRLLGIQSRIVRSQEVPTQSTATQRLADLCRAVGGDTYLSGAFAVEQYVDPALLEAAGVQLALQNWQAPSYQQLYSAAGFVPDLSIVDLLFNEGPRSLEILLAAGNISHHSS